MHSFSKNFIQNFVSSMVKFCPSEKNDSAIQYNKSTSGIRIGTCTYFQEYLDNSDQLCNLPAFMSMVLCSLLALNVLANMCDSSKQSSRMKSWAELK